MKKKKKKLSIMKKDCTWTMLIEMPLPHPLPQLKGGKILLEKMHVFGIAILTALTKIK